MSKMLLLALIILSAELIFGQEEDSELFTPPIRHPQGRYSDIWENSPFELEAAPQPVIEQTKEIPKNDYFLAGVIKKGEEYVAYVQNRKTNAVTKVTATANPEGFLLKEVIPGESPGEFIAKVEKQGQPLTLSYDRKSAAAPARPPSSTAGANPTLPGTPYNPAKLALEKARQKALEARKRAGEKGKAQEPSKVNTRKRTIFVPK
ncbi:MAG: hypothetical protein P1V20_21740 [Verrucomicrobiales bacterium]|nr:hypothetical protein [Verrucomicrobiales bacterium]